MLPIPPIPIKFVLNVDNVQNDDTRQALAVAVNSLAQRARDPTVVHNSHSIIAALTLFSDWCKFGEDNKENAKLTKDGLVLELMRRCLEAGNGRGDCCVHEDIAYEIFYDVTKEWILCSLPPDAEAACERASAQVPQHEDNIHISISHYCFSQGVLYSAKGGLLNCPTHTVMVDRFQEKVQAVMSDASCFEAREIDDESIRKEQQEVAEIYSQNSYASLLSLCFSRIHRDSLLGHSDSKQIDMTNVKDLAKSLLDAAIDTHRKVLKEKNLPEIADDLQLATRHRQVEVDDMQSCLSDLQVTDQTVGSPDCSSTELFVRLLAVCLHSASNPESWLSLARNLEDYQELLKASDRNIVSACSVVNRDHLSAILKPIVSAPDASFPGMKRVDQCLLEIESGRRDVSSLDHSKLSFTTELGVLIRNVATDPNNGKQDVIRAAFEMHRQADSDLVKAAAETFDVFSLYDKRAQELHNSEP